MMRPSPDRATGPIRARVALLMAVGPLIGCGGGPPAPPMAIPAPVPLAVLRPEPRSMAFAGDEEVPPVSFAFEGSPGNTRVTMEVEGISVTATPSVPTINDVLFPVAGQGRIAIGFRRPWPGHEEGRVTIRCSSADSESTAEFEPELWFRHPSAVVSYESPLGEPTDPVAVGKEIVLARYVARNLPRDLRLTLKVIFSKEPIAPRVKAGVKPPR